jgi:hypothetical protein
VTELLTLTIALVLALATCNVLGYAVRRVIGIVVYGAPTNNEKHNMHHSCCETAYDAWVEYNDRRAEFEREDEYFCRHGERVDVVCLACENGTYADAAAGRD